MNVFFKERLKFRKIPSYIAEEVLMQSEEKYYDRETERNIAVHEIKYGGRYRLLMLAYEEHEDYIELVTIHEIQKFQIVNRINSGRWTTIL